jgi:streptogramin lyase
MMVFGLLASSPGFTKIPGVPHELRRDFKSSHRFPEEILRFKGQELKVRKGPLTNQPVLIYDVPSFLKPSEVLNELVSQKFLPLRFSLQRDLELSQGVEEKSQNPLEVREVYSLTFQGRKVENAFVKIFTFSRSSLAVGMRLPNKIHQPFLFRNKENKRFMLIQDKVVAYDKISLGKETFYLFPPEANLPPKRVQEVVAKKAQGSVEKVPLSRGNFPDQIQAPSSPVLWFTQPNDNLLTSYNWREKTWTHTETGEGPDGLAYDPSGALWVGEHQEGRLGRYDLKNKSYQGFPLPYAEASAAIPFVDSRGQVWISDHFANKVSSFDYEKKNWISVDLPRAGSWPVSFTEYKNKVYVSQCYGDSLGILSETEGEWGIVDFPLGSSGCPTFLVEQNGYLWVTLWTSGSLLRFDPKTSEVIEFSLQGERGTGPIAIVSENMISFGSLMKKKVYLMNTKTHEISYLEGVGRLKDGLVVDSDLSVWVTETNGGLVKVDFDELKRLKIPAKTD